MSPRNPVREVNPKQSTANVPATTDMPIQELAVPKVMTPAAVVGMSTKVQIDQDQLPEEFRGAKLEIIESGFDPTVKWMEPGNFVAGIYRGYEENVGRNSATLYSFETKQGKGFGVWGSSVLDRTLKGAVASGQLQPGYMVLITFVGEIPSKQNNDTMIFQVAVVKR